MALLVSPALDSSPRSPRVLVAQIGARRNYLVPRALAEAGHLERFCTDLYFGRRPWLDPFVATLLGDRAVRFRDRNHPSLPLDLVVDSSYVSLANLSAHGSESERWISAGRLFARAVVRSGFGRADSVVAFSSAALEIFQAARTNRISTVLDHATAPRDREMAIVRDEEERFPGWSASPVGHDPALQLYAQRQKEERGLADSIICGSRFVAGILEEEGVQTSKIRIVPLGISTRYNTPKRKNKRHGQALHVLFVGNEGLRKGLGYLLQAVKRLRSSTVQLRIAGDPGFTQHGMAEVSQVCEECRPVPRSQIQSWYDWADVLVLPTLSDTFGLVILEAMAAGVPVITTHASAGPDVIRDGVDGWLVPLRDPYAIAQRIDTLLTTPELVSDMGVSARARAAQFDSAAYIHRLLEAITS